MRPLAIAVIAASWCAFGCGGAPPPGGTVRVAEPLPDGEAVYRLRYNPPPCIADQPELHVELKTPAGWERVALESGVEEVDQVQALLVRFGRSPGAVVPVLGNLTDRARTWAGQHASRVFVVQAVDPPVEPDATEAPPDESEPDRVDAPPAG